MGQVKHRLKNLPIMPTFLLLSTGFLFVAMLLVEIERTLLFNAQQEIVFRYTDVVEGFNEIKAWGNHAEYYFSAGDSRKIYIYEMLSWLLPPLTYFVCTFLASWLFSRSKLKTPLHILSTSAQRIANSDLDFVIAYDKTDEMGQICLAFETMRSTLESNHREMWRQMEDRKRLNAAFSHDLRTPLTVLEGHLNILQKYAPEGTLSADDVSETYSVMASQLNRLKSYVSSMSDLQRLEDIPIAAEPVDTAELLRSLNDTAEIICAGQLLTFHHEVHTDTVVLDAEIVMQVFENLLSNAVRYAKTSVSVVCKTQDNAFLLSVMDDGNGFDPVALKSATDPFYTTEKKAGGQHFGLGLNICKILCLRHNGSISLTNLASGGASVTATFGIHGIG